MSNIAVSKIWINVYEMFSASPVQTEGSYYKACVKFLQWMPAQHAFLSSLAGTHFGLGVPVTPHFRGNPCASWWVSLIGNPAPPHQGLAEEWQSPAWPMRPKERFWGAPGKPLAHCSRTLAEVSLALFWVLSWVGVRLRPLRLPHHQRWGWSQYKEENGRESQETGLSAGLSHLEPVLLQFPVMPFSKSV